MSIDPNLAGKQFNVGQFSLGTNSGTDPIIYTENDAGSELGANTIITVNSVATGGGVTSIQATISGSTVFGGFANGPVNGTIIANNTSSIILTGMLDGQNGTVLLTNNPADQPGVNGTTSIPAVGDNNAYVAPCFVTGTLIKTVRGDVAVEDLVVGDLAITASGKLRPIRWLGHRVTDCHHHPRPHEVHPIRIFAHAFGASMPERDLYLSPGHPVLVKADADNEGGYLVPIMCLINGTTVCRVAVETVTYWHVELDEHDILLAENLPAESYLDWGDRVFFSESSNDALANPDLVVPGLSNRCRPVAVNGPVVDAEHKRLDAIFASRLSLAAGWPNDRSELPAIF